MLSQSTHKIYIYHSLLCHIGEVLGQTLDTMMKMQCIKEILGTASALSINNKEDDQVGFEEGSDSDQNLELLKLNHAYRNVIVVSIQDLYLKTNALFMVAFPRLINVEVWQLVGEGLKNFSETTSTSEQEQESQPNLLKLAQKSQLVLRQIMTFNEDEFIKPNSQPSGFIDWPKLALEELHLKFKQNRGKPFKLLSGQFVIPITDPGPKGSYLATSTSTSRKAGGGSHHGVSATHQPRKHAIVLRGDDRFPWNQDVEMMSYYAKVIELHLYRIRRNTMKEGGGGGGQFRRVLSSEIQESDDSDDSEEDP